MTDQNTFDIAELQQKANEGDAQAQFDLALCYANGTGIERNMGLAFDWHKKAAEQDHVDAQFAMGIYYFISFDKQQIIVVIQTWLSYEQITEFSDFFKLQPNGQELDFTFVRLAPAKNLAMKLAMAARGCDKDDDLAFLWLTKAAYQDHPDASYWQGLCYRDGIGTQQNDELTFACFKKAAEQGCSDAYYWLALYYLNGKGCQQNDELAFVWITKAVEYADAYFLFNITTGFGINLAEIYLFIGKLYAEGKGVVQNDELAFKWFAKAAEHKLAKAQYCLADCYEYGKGVDRNINLADKWYEEADQQDHFEAEDQFRLAERFLQKNYNLGMKWMIRSAHAGNSDAYNWLINAFLNLAIPEELLDKVNDAELYKFTFDWCSKKALSNNETEANLLLGSLYSAGKGIQQSDDLAFDCFERAQKTFGDLDPEPEDMLTDLYLQLYLSNCYAQGKGVNKDLSKAESYFRYYSDYIDTLGSNFMNGIGSLGSTYKTQNINVFLTLLRIDIYKFSKKYDLAKEYIEEVFEKAGGVDKSFKEICLATVEQKEEEREALNKALHEKEKEMLSFFTHTMRNALATAPESLRQAIHLLGSDVYEKDTKHYKAINKIAALFSTLSLTDCLIDTFKQSISDPQEFKQSWRLDHSGDASPRWVIASALKQSLNRITFMSDTNELRKLLSSQETALVKATRKAFIEDVLPLNVDQQGVDAFFEWSYNHIPTIEVVISNADNLSFGVNQIRFSLLFAITSELILNALKYWDGENRIQIGWQLAEQDNYVFSVTNHCKANAASNLAGTHKGLAFIKRLVELLGDQAHFVCKTEDQLFTTELILNKALFDEES